MSYNVIVHPANAEPIEGEIDELPPPNATFIAVKNPRRRSNKDLDWLDQRTTTLLISFAHLVSVELSTPRSSEDLITKYYGSSAH